MHSMFGSKGGRVPPPTRKLVIRKANSQRDLRAITERITLEKVLGITAATNASMACNPVNGIIAYPAGCIVVLFNPRKNKQKFIHNTSKKTITAVAFSRDGKYLATGESGHLPSVRVWSMEDPTNPQVSEMAKGHKHGVACVAFSPNLKYLVSVGYQHDMLINIWNWKDGSKAACNKVSTKVFAICFSETANFFVTCGIRHVKFWYFDTETNKSKHNKTLPIMGRSALLGELRNNAFCDVACGTGENSDYTYCVTNSGMLCSFGAKRVLDKWVELRASKAQCIAVSEKYIFCGCTDGIIRVFNPSTLEFVNTLPKPHFLGVNIADGIDPSHLIPKTGNVSYADTVALALDTCNYRLTCVYNDHSLYVWDLKDIKKIGKIWSSLYHSACVWGVEVYPEVSDNKHAALPPGTFLTCSADDTVRVWNVVEGTNISFQRNIYSKELMRVLYLLDNFSNLKDTEHSITSKNVNDVSSDGRTGVRTICASPDGQTLAVGDRSGNVRVYDMMFLDELLKIEAHESEVLCVEFSPPQSGHKLLASAGRDRLIHIFDMNKDFSLIQTLDDHSASITSIKFNVDDNGDFQLLSCSADKSIIFRSAQQNPDLQFVRNTNYVGKTTFYDMVVDTSRHVAATACQDRNVRIYDTVNGKQTRSFKGATGDDGTLVKITMDNSGYYAATSCSDKTMSFHEFETGECMASMTGHSEIVTGIRFTNDCKRLISVSGDGCIFIWKIPTTFTQNMEERMADLGQELPKATLPETPLRRGTYKVEETVSSDNNGTTERDNTPAIDYRFSIGKLPSWAKKQLIGESGGDSSSPDGAPGAPVQPSGRWAQRVLPVDACLARESSPLRPTILSLSDSPGDRKAFTTTSAQEQVDALMNSPLERKCSLTKGEDDDLFNADYREQFNSLTEEDIGSHKHPREIPLNVSVSRGSAPFDLQASRDQDLLIQTEEVKFEEVEELPEEDVKESIIYLPNSQDNMDIETARVTGFRGVKQMTQHFESLHASGGRQWHRFHMVHTGVHHLSEARRDLFSHYGDNNDLTPSKIEKVVPRSFQVTAAQQPERRSVEDEQEHEGNSRVTGKRKNSESSSDEEDDSEEPLTPQSEVSKNDNGDNKPDTPDEEDDEVCRKYFEGLGSTPTKCKPEVEIAPEVAPSFAETNLPLLQSRLSISARFLSKSHFSMRGGVSNGFQAIDENAEKARAAALEQHKLEIKKRKEEMARAVDATRERLIALGWKGKEGKTTPPATSTMPTTPLSSSINISLKPLSPRSASISSETTDPTLTREEKPPQFQAQEISNLENKMSCPTNDGTLSNKDQGVEQSLLGSTDILTRSSSTTETSGTSAKTSPVTSASEMPVVTSSGSRSVTPSVTPSLTSSESSAVTSSMTSSVIVKQDSSLDDAFDRAPMSSSSAVESVEIASEKTTNGLVTSLCHADTPVHSNTSRHMTPFQTRLVSESNSAFSSKNAKNTNPIETSDAKPDTNSSPDNISVVRGLGAPVVSRDDSGHAPLSVTQDATKLVPERDNDVWVLRDNGRKSPEVPARPRQSLAELLEHPTKKDPSSTENHSLLEEKDIPRDKKSDKELKEEKKEKEKERMKKEEKHKEKTKKEEKEREKEKEKTKKEEKESREKEKTKKEEKESKEKDKQKKDPPSGKLEKRDSMTSLTAHTKSSWRRTLGFGGFKSKDKKEDRKSLPAFVSTVKSTEATISKQVEKAQLRDKRGRVSAEERKAKARSMGDLDQRMKPSAKDAPTLDMSVPPTRVMSTMDIPEVVEEANASPRGRKGSPPRDKGGVVGESAILSQGSQGSSPRSEDGKVESEIALAAEQELSEPSYIERKPLVEVSDTGESAPTESEQPAPVCKSDRSKSLGIEHLKVSDEREKQRSHSDGGILPFLDVTSLTAELSAAIACPPPQPISLPLNVHCDEGEGAGGLSPPVSSRKSPIGKDRDSVDLSSGLTREVCEDAVNKLVRAFQSVTDLHTKALEEEQSEEAASVLSLLSATFSAMEEQIYHCRNRRKYANLGGRLRAAPFDSKPLSSSYSFSTGNLDRIRAEPASMMGRRASEASVLMAVEEEDARIESVLERISDRLVDLVQKKLTK
ncbi:mitogen-activated protein kinase-binding protein 1 isoform X2 [Nematostella vectensis]|uniref:mitogen-activated protein kinase-binding protein 1 isoform X2 n=1 Tax=Nematostella vectensis TaxID=45351 RepID=UPI00207734ED|nr:mitogen-activated protein kinase-binding protein 1 isoform X2 [Nematostella vectensis]